MKQYQYYFLLALFLITGLTSYSQPCTVSLGSNISICAGSSATLVANVANGPAGGFNWTPGGLPNNDTVQVAPANTTTYSVTLTGGNCNGISASVTVTVIPLPNNPTVNITNNNTCEGTSVSLSTPPQSGVNFHWDFGDGTSANGANASHSYNAPAGSGNQNYTATVTATNASNCVRTSTQLVTVKQKPDAVLNNPIYNFRFCGGGIANVGVYDLSTPATNANYAINWGDGASSTSTTAPSGVSHTYQSGVFTLTYTVTGTNGCSNTKQYVVYNITNPQIGAANPGNTQGCGPKSICFPINTFAANDSSTTYTVTFGDNTPPQYFSHPPPDTICHTYSISSCGQPNNSYTFKIVTGNGCDTSDATITPVRIYTKPTAQFSATPNPACVNQAVTFTNNTIAGLFSNLCDSSALYTWNFGDGSSPFSTPSKAAQTHTYTAGGTYTVTLTSENGCGPSTFSLPVCVQTPPVSLINANPLTGCAPLPVNFTNNSTGTNQCGTPTYQWLVSQTTSTCTQDSANPYVFTQGSATSGTNPVIRFNNAGVYSVVLKITNACGPISSAAQTITVKKKPELNLSVAPTNICVGEFVSPTATALPCGDVLGSYNWTFPGGNPATSNQQNPGNVSYSTGGTKTITVSIQNSCGTVSANTSVTVTTPSQANAGADQTACINTSNVQLTGIPAGGTWSGTNVTSTGVFSPIQAGTYTLLYTVGVGNCVGRDSMVFTVNPQPPLTLTPGPSICTGFSTTLTATGANTYSWSPVTGLSSTTGATVTANPTTTTTYTVTATNTTTNCTATASTTVTVNALSVVSIGPDQTLCNQPIPVQLTGNPSGGTWAGPNTSSTGIFTPNGTGTSQVIYTYTNANSCISKDTLLITVVNPTTPNASTDQTICQNSGNLQLTGTPAGGVWSGNNVNASGSFTTGQAGIFDLVYSYGSTTCLKADTVTISVNAAPIITIAPNTPAICTGQNINLTGSGASTYSWSPAAGLNTTSGATVNASPSNTTTYSVTGTNAGTNCTATQSISLTVNNLPVVNAGADLTVCNQPIPFNLTGTPAGGVWSGPNISSSGTFTPAGNGVFTEVYTFTNSNNCTGRDTAIITVVNPSTVNAGNDTALCLNGASVQFAPTPPGGTWSGSALVSASGVFSPTQSGTFTLIYALGNGTCLKTDTLLVTVNPLPAISISPAAPSFCVGQNVTLTATGATAYSWSPAINLNTTTGPTVIASPATTTSYTVNGTNGGTGCAATAQVTVTVNPLPVVSAGPDSVICNQPIPVSLTGTPQGGTWSGPNIAANGVFTPATTGTFTVTYTYTNGNNCLSRDSAVITVVNPATVNAGNDTALCLNSGAVQLTATPAGGNWQGTALVSQSGLFTPSQQGSFSPYYTYGSGSCLKRDTVVIVVNPLPVVGISPSTTICEADTISLTATGANSYNWSPAAGLSSTTAPMVAASPALTTTYIVTGTNAATGCTNNASATITVNPLPDITNTDTVQVLCSDDALTIALQSDVNGATYSWTATPNNNLSAFPLSGNTSIINIASLHNNTNVVRAITYTVVPTAASCPGPPQQFVVTINPRPVISITPDFQAFCSGGTSTAIAITTDINGTSLNWSGVAVNLSNPVLSGSGNTIPAQTLFNTSSLADTAQVIYTITSTVGGCPGNNVTAEILVNPTPIVGFAMNTNTGCSPLHVSFAANTQTFGNPDSLVYNWGDGTADTTLLPNPIQPVWSTIGHTFVNNTLAAVTYTISLTGYNACGDSTVTQSLTVQPNTVNAFFTPSVVSGCEPLQVTFTDFSTGATNTSWCFNYYPQRDSCGGLSTVVAPGTTMQQTFTAGSHTVALYITDGCSRDTVFETINVTPSPIADFTYDNNVCVNAPLTFNQQATSPAGVFLTGYNWQFGDADSAIGASVVHIYDTTGVFNTCLTATGSNGCANTKCYPITILDKPLVDFTGFDTCVNTQPIQFTNSSSGVSFFNWSFGDGNTSVLANPANAFMAPGTYTVKLIGSNTFCSDTAVHTFVVYPIPTAAFNLPNTFLCGLPAQVQITNTSVDAQGYAWDLGNGTSTTATNPVATYNSAGNYAVLLDAANQYNCHDTATHSIDVYPYPVIQSIDVQGAEGCQPQQVTVTATVTDGNTYTFNFGDGTAPVSLLGPVAEYNYPDTGTYTITVTAYSYLTCGDTAILTDTVKVHITPAPDFSFVTNTTIEPIDGTVNFTNLSQNADTYLWDFADGFTSADINPIHRFENVDSFSVKLTAYTSYGCDSSITKTVYAFKRALYVPNYLEPVNASSNNLLKVWQPVGIGLYSYHAQVFNTWGELLWESNDLVDTKPSEYWDGTYKGQLCAQDVYVWKIEAVFLDNVRWEGMSYETGKPKKTIGSITLIR